MHVPRPPNQGGDASDNAWAAGIFLLILVVVIILPSVLTLGTVRDAIKHRIDGNPTPYGYTVSLLIFVLPTTALLVWFLRRHPRGSFRRRAFWWTIGLLVPVGFTLDLVFGNLFFRFPNADATVRVFVPGYSFVTGGMVRDLPIEEFVFYLSGFGAILLIYIWCDEVWVPAYGVADYGDVRRHPPYVIQPHWQSLLWGVGLVAIALAYKKLLAPVLPDRDFRQGFPLYFTFLVMASVVPSLLFYRCARPFVNWRALSLTLLWVLFSSLLWEATLASPYGWWHYRHEWMMGLHVKAWADLPVEAVVLWVAVAFTTTIVYETVKVGLHMERPFPPGLLGRAGTRPTRPTGP